MRNALNALSTETCVAGTAKATSAILDILLFLKLFNFKNVKILVLKANLHIFGMHFSDSVEVNDSTWRRVVINKIVECFIFFSKSTHYNLMICMLNKSINGDQQIWSEMNLYDDSFLDKIIDDDQRLPQEDDLISEVSYKSVKDSDREFFDKLNNEFNNNYWPDKNEFEGQCDIHLYLEKPHLVDDFTF
ncbi:hypothetical protein FF38_14269 [Lucilia cuprina]|uniref:Uncharacterized protein n=1 Tax=Lucilia cuprina TaxID=7375 RepID=A0A0L0CPG7_LUCCU|nr:hypothetical protein FF38_14269 [Lucilia cuprina]